MPFLVRIPAGGGPPERYPLKAGSNTIGRSRENDIVLHDASLSRVHARVDVEDGGSSVLDLGSRNGTFVGGLRVLQCRLKHGDAVQLGELSLRFEEERTVRPSGFSSPELSLVIPAYNEEKRLPVSLARIADWLGSRTPAISAEVLVVDDGSSDRTAAVAEKTAGGLGLAFRVIRLPENRGKGAAVRAGALEAKGAHVLVTDADLSTPIEEVDKLLAAGAPVAIGSRGVDATLVKQRQSLFRVASGRLFNLLVRVLAVSGIRDTQCGFKLFRADAAREVFSRAVVDRFAFDVEALLLARRLGFAIKEVPVLWFNSPDTRVGLGGGLEAFAALFRIRFQVARTMRQKPPEPAA